MPEVWKITRVETSNYFERAFRKLPKDLQQKVVERIAIFKQNPIDPKLKTHKLIGKLTGDWSFSVDYHNRIRFRILSKGVVLLIDVGSHDIYKKRWLWITNAKNQNGASVVRCVPITDGWAMPRDEPILASLSLISKISAIIDKKFADETLTKMADYRNRMIHFYLELTNQEIYAIIRDKLGDFEIFARAIVKLLEKPKKFNLDVSE